MEVSFQLVPKIVQGKNGVFITLKLYPSPREFIDFFFVVERFSKARRS